MKYFLDTEFIEGFHKPLFGKRRHFIDLISIGLVAEDGREYYAISSEFNPNKANQWVKDNVIHPIEIELYKKLSSAEKYFGYSRSGLSYLLKRFGKSNNQIAEDIKKFVGMKKIDEGYGEYWSFPEPSALEFYGYYADYDWVLFCSLFGTMMDLPKGFPMYCRDLKQILDDKAVGRMPLSLESNIEFIKKKPGYPKQENEHNALDDAKWNKSLFIFLETL